MFTFILQIAPCMSMFIHHSNLPYSKQILFATVHSAKSGRKSAKWNNNSPTLIGPSRESSRESIVYRTYLLLTYLVRVVYITAETACSRLVFVLLPSSAIVARGSNFWVNCGQHAPIDWEFWVHDTRHDSGWWWCRNNGHRLLVSFSVFLFPYFVC